MNMPAALVPDQALELRTGTQAPRTVPLREIETSAVGEMTIDRLALHRLEGIAEIVAETGMMAAVSAMAVVVVLVVEADLDPHTDVEADIEALVHGRSLTMSYRFLEEHHETYQTYK